MRAFCRPENIEIAGVDVDTVHRRKIREAIHSGKRITVLAESLVEFLNGKRDTLLYRLDGAWREARPPHSRDSLYRNYICEMDSISEENGRSLGSRIKEMYCSGAVITVCSLSYCEFAMGKRSAVLHSIDGHWLPFLPPMENYPNYSHGLSPQLAALYYPTFWEKYSRRRLAASLSSRK